MAIAAKEKSYNFQRSWQLYYFRARPYDLQKKGERMKTIKILATCLLLAGCVPGDCTKDCYILRNIDLELSYKCEIDPYRYDCPVRR